VQGNWSHTVSAFLDSFYLIYLEGTKYDATVCSSACKIKDVILVSHTVHLFEHYIVGENIILHFSQSIQMFLAMQISAI